MGLSDTELAELACVNFRILDIAARIITPENKEEVMALVLALGERDAKVALAEMADPEQATSSASSVSSPVKSLMRRYRELPDDYRLEFLSQVNPRRIHDRQPVREQR